MLFIFNFYRVAIIMPWEFDPRDDFDSLAALEPGDWNYHL
jgi:hypothetical protein